MKFRISNSNTCILPGEIASYPKKTLSFMEEGCSNFLASAVYLLPAANSNYNLVSNLNKCQMTNTSEWICWISISISQSRSLSS